MKRYKVIIRLKNRSKAKAIIKAYGRFEAFSQIPETFEKAGIAYDDIWYIEEVAELIG